MVYRYRVTHETTYHYPHDVSISHNLAHLKAREHSGQSCLGHSLWFSVPPAVSASETDYFGNPVTFFTVQEPHRSLTVRAENVVEVRPGPLPEALGS